ncbi:hypothetical protein PIB30_060294 [Stylosanthes scabra]|uniref:Uncharacterized protein n=1 Tax=Stylosanthes scabra TaxID=79078 RepID=A0ABU6VKR7_9FABA|nr:hypothetical protein [Stylosanthes scabra]
MSFSIILATRVLRTFYHDPHLAGDTKRVQRVYYRYPHEVDGTFCFKRFRLRDDADVALIREWHLHLAVMPLQPEGSSDGSVPFSNQPAEDVGDSHEESVVGDPTTHPYLLDNDSDNDDVDNEPAVLPPEEEEDDEEEEEEDVQGVNYFGHTQPAYAQPAIS